MSDMDTYQEQERVVTPFPNPDESINVTKDGVQFPQNIIVTTRYTMLSFFPKSLFEQFRRLANVYFLVLGCIAAIGMATEYYDTAVEPAGLLIPLTIVVLISVAKDGIEDTKRNKADNRTNSRATRVVSSDVRDTYTDWLAALLSLILSAKVNPFLFYFSANHRVLFTKFNGETSWWAQCCCCRAMMRCPPTP